MIGKVYGDFKCTKLLPKVKYEKQKCEYECQVCGAKKIVNSYDIRRGKGTKHGKSCSIQLGGFDKRFYSIWHGIRKRTTTSSTAGYENYGGRGIRSDSWEFFIDFHNDMWESYVDHLNKYGERDTTIDRIDVNGDYTKDNCRWATRAQQTENRRTQKNQYTFKATRLSDNFEITMTNQHEFERKYGVPQSQVSRGCRTSTAQQGWIFEIVNTE